MRHRLLPWLLLAVVVAGGLAAALRKREDPTPASTATSDDAKGPGPTLASREAATPSVRVPKSSSGTSADGGGDWVVRGTVVLSGSTSAGTDGKARVRIEDGPATAASQVGSGQPFELRFRPTAESHLLQVTAEGYLPRSLHLVEADSRVGEIVLIRGLTYRGRLLDPQGAPMKGVRVSLRRLQHLGGPATDPTDDRGEFAIPLEGAGLSVEVDDAGALAQYELYFSLRGGSLPPVPASPAGLSDVHVVRLQQAMQPLVLLVTRTDGSPAVGARVVVQPVMYSARNMGPRELPPVSEGVVDASGHFLPEWPMWRPVLLASIGDVSSEPRYFVLEHARVAATQPYPIVLGGDERLLELAMQDGRGGSLPGAKVLLRLPIPSVSRTYPADLQGVADSNGRVRWLLADTADASFRLDPITVLADVEYQAGRAGWELGRGTAPIAIAGRDVSAAMIVEPTDDRWERPLWIVLSPGLEARVGRPLQMVITFSMRERTSATVVGDCDLRAPLVGEGGDRLWPMHGLTHPQETVVEAATAWVRFESGASRRFDLPPATWIAAADSRTPFLIAALQEGASLRVSAVEPEGVRIPRAVVATVCIDESVRTRPVSMRRVSATDEGSALLSDLPAGARWYVWVQSPDGILAGGTEVSLEVGEREVTVRAEAARDFTVRVTLPDGSIPEEAICVAKPIQPETAFVRNCKYDPKAGRFSLPRVQHSLFTVEVTAFVTERLVGGRTWTHRFTGGGRMADRVIQLAPYVPPASPSVPAVPSVPPVPK